MKSRCVDGGWEIERNIYDAWGGVGAWASDQLTWSKSGVSGVWLAARAICRTCRGYETSGRRWDQALEELSWERGRSCRAKKVVTVVRMTSPKVSALGSASGAQCPTWRRETEERVELQVKVSLAAECFLETNV